MHLGCPSFLQLSFPKLTVRYHPNSYSQCIPGHVHGLCMDCGRNLRNRLMHRNNSDKPLEIAKWCASEILINIVNWEQMKIPFKHLGVKGFIVWIECFRHLMHFTLYSDFKYCLAARSLEVICCFSWMVRSRSLMTSSRSLNACPPSTT